MNLDAKILLLLALMLVCRLSATAQTSTQVAPGTEKAAEVMSRAQVIYREKGAQTALPEFEKALALFRAESDRLGESITLRSIGNCYKKFGDFRRALEHLQQALAIQRDLGNRLEQGKTHNSFGLVYWEMGQYANAISEYENAVAAASEAKNQLAAAAVQNNIGLVYDELGDYKKANSARERALELYRSITSEPANEKDIQRGMSDVIGNIGGGKLLIGEYSQALRYYEEALATDERLNLKAETSLDLQNIGLSYIGLGRAQEALSYLDRSIKLAAEAGVERYAADSRKGKGSALLQMGKYTEALEQYRQALQTYEKAGLKQSLVEGLLDLGNLELRLGDIPAAEQEFRRAQQLATEMKNVRGVITSLLSLSDLEWQRKRHQEAARLSREALSSASETGERGLMAAAQLQLALAYRSLKQWEAARVEAQKAREIASATQSRPLEAEALYAQGEIARNSGQHMAALEFFSAGHSITAQITLPEISWRLDFARGQTLEALGRNSEALAAYESAIRTIELVRSDLREERYRAGYIEDKYQVYVGLVELLLKMGRANDAFIFAEKLRARSYLDLLSRAPSPIRKENQRQKEKQLQNRIKLLQKHIAEETSKAAPDQRRAALELFSSELNTAEREYQTFLDDLAESEPAYASVRALRVPSGEEIQQKLTARTALIEYLVSADYVHIFVITSKKLHATTVSVRADDLNSKVGLLRELMLRNTTDEWKLPAAKLYELLIKPVKDAGELSGIDRVYIVPHAGLHYLPFAVLPQRAASARSLIDDYTIAYLPAAAALIYGRGSTTRVGSVLAMAPLNVRLKHTEEESRTVSSYFPGRNKLLIGSQATETSFKQLGSGFDVIHLATHGYFNKFNPVFSGLLLEADEANDGRLEVHEILELKLDARLVTLSACDTALGSGYFTEVPAGDDLVGLTRAFLFAGTPSVLASLWEVNDQSAVRLMRSFYRSLGQNEKADALAQAQRVMRASRGHRHPYYWGAFVLVGTM